MKSSSNKTSSNKKQSSKSSKRSSIQSSGFLLTCDPPAKQFIRQLDEKRSVDKKFILEDLDATHLLIDGKAIDEIERKVEAWMDEVSSSLICQSIIIFLKILFHSILYVRIM